VRQHEAAAVDLVGARRELAVRDVDRHVRLERRALAEEQVGAARLGDELVRPRRVARVDDRAPVGLEPIPQAAELFHVRHDERPNTDVPDGLLRAGRELLVLEGKIHGLERGLLVERLEQALRPSRNIGRAVDGERARARHRVAVLHEQERYAGEMVAVEVRDQDEIDAPRVDPQPLQSLQDGRPAVDEERPLRRLDQVGAVHATARAEGVSAAENRHLDQGDSPQGDAQL